MNYYPFHIGDYMVHTRHLSLMEDLAYRRLLDLYYTHEGNLPADAARLIGMREHATEVETVLGEFFPGGKNKRADEELAKYQGFADAGKRGAVKRWGKGGDSPPIAPLTPPVSTPNSNQEPVTKNQEPEKREPRATRLANPFILESDWGIWARNERPDLDPLKTAEKFADHWHAKPGKDGLKLDWFATWRNWVKAERASPARLADVARVTVPLDPRNLYVAPPAMTRDERAASDKRRLEEMARFKTARTA